MPAGWHSVVGTSPHTTNTIPDHQIRKSDVVPTLRGEATKFACSERPLLEMDAGQARAIAHITVHDNQHPLTFSPEGTSKGLLALPVQSNCFTGGTTWLPQRGRE